MIKSNLSILARQAEKHARALALAAAALALALGAISCGTVTRSVVVLPNVPGAQYIGSKECEQCHDDLYKGFCHRGPRPADRGRDQRPQRGMRIVPRALQRSLRFRRRNPASLHL